MMRSWKEKWDLRKKLETKYYFKMNQLILMIKVRTIHYEFRYFLGMLFYLMFSLLYML